MARVGDAIGWGAYAFSARAALTGAVLPAGVSFAIGTASKALSFAGNNAASRRWDWQPGDQLAIWISRRVYYRGRWAENSCHVRSHYFYVTADIYRNNIRRDSLGVKKVEARVEDGKGKPVRSSILMWVKHVRYVTV